MVRSALADENLLTYFNNIAKQYPFVVGLIIGQSVAGKDYIIHFAKTPPNQSEETQDNNIAILKSISDVDEDWVSDHARQATRMLPGGMQVLGVFTVAPDDMLNPFNPKLKSILNKIHRQLELHKYIFGNGDSNEKLLVNYNKTTQQCTSKSYDIATGGVKPAELKFLSNEMKWTQIECKYQLNQIYNIDTNENDSPLKKHMSIILDKVNDDLDSSTFLYDGELKDGDESIESFGKKTKSRSNKSSNHDDDHVKSLQVCILQPCKTKNNTFAITDTSNQIRILGHVVSKLWLNSKMTIQAVSDCIRQDIMRSLSTRLEMHWDSLTEEEHGEDMNSVHEPPRRVLIPLPNSNIAISDYLFPGEGPQDAQISLEEMLDIKINNESDVLDVEGQAEVADYYNEGGMETESEEVVAKKSTITNDSNRALGMIALGVTLLILIISLVINFIQS